MSPMPLLHDDFNRSAVLTTPWTVKTGDTWTATGTRLRVDGTPDTVRRAVIQTVNVYTYLVSVTPRVYEVEAQIIMPTAFSSTANTYAGVVFMSAGANAAFSHYELVWWRDSSNNQRLIWLRRDSTGTASVVGPALGATLATAATVSETHKLTARITVLTAPAAVGVTAYWDGALAYSASAGFVPTLGFSSSDITVTPHYCGLTATVPGPANVSGNPTNPLYFDNFRVRDVNLTGTQAANPPALTLSAEPVLSTSAVGAEDTNSGASLTTRPSYVVEIVDIYRTSEITYDCGISATVARTSRPRRRWHVRWNALDDAEIAIVETLHVDAQGTALTFDFSDPETGQTVRVRAVADWEVTHVSCGVWAAATTIEEVF